MNEKIEYYLNKIIVSKTVKIYIHLIFALLLMILSIYLYFNYDRTFYIYLLVGIIGLLFFIISFISRSMRKEIYWMKEHYITNKEEVIDYLKIYIQSVEHNLKRNLIFRLTQKKEISHYHALFKELTEK